MSPLRHLLRALLAAACVCAPVGLVQAAPPEAFPGVEGSSTGGWRADVFGFLRTSYLFVQQDKLNEAIGRNAGFAIQNARLGVSGSHRRLGIDYRLSLDAAQSFLQGDQRESLGAALRDAYVSYHLGPFFSVQLGQFKAPFTQEELRSTTGLLFADRALGVRGVPEGHGDLVRGISAGRQLGLMLFSTDPIPLFADLGLRYGVMAANGNGANALVNDNSSLALLARLQLTWAEIVRVGGAVFYNERSAAGHPDEISEVDLSYAADLWIDTHGLEIFAQLIEKRTQFEKTRAQPQPAETRRQRAWHAQVGYLFDLAVPLQPGYRIASFDPWLAGGDAAEAHSALLYHTLGLEVRHPAARLGLSVFLNYTFTQEESARSLRNDRLEILGQFKF